MLSTMCFFHLCGSIIWFIFVFHCSLFGLISSTWFAVIRYAACGDAYGISSSKVICIFSSISLIFSPLRRDGTSIILSDDVGQLYILSTGQGESQKDAKYDQVLEEYAHLFSYFFLFDSVRVFMLIFMIIFAVLSRGLSATYPGYPWECCWSG